MSKYVNWENQLNNILKWQGSQGRKFVTEQLKLWSSSEKNIFKSINDYKIIDFKQIYYKDADVKQEYLVVRNDFRIFKSFENSNEAIDYCLDKINTENKQNSLNF